MNPTELPYTLVVPSRYGQVLVNRFDTNQTNALIKTGESLDHGEIDTLLQIIQMLPAGQVFLDVGANFGLYSLAMAQLLKATDGKVIAFEAQRILFNMVCGSVALNSLENLYVHHAAVSDKAGFIGIPKLDYRQVTSFGSVEFGGEQQELLTQMPGASTEDVRTITLDSLDLPRVDMIKMDIEGMEEQALMGATALLETHRPITFIEWLKSDKPALVDFFATRNYRVYEAGMNLLCIPKGAERDGITVLGVTTLVE
ncbi:MAG: FkbM family methyltransferase [Cytophagales bacterium]|nr:FkbM family methyltransferase [Cytophagales bacterium]